MRSLIAVVLIVAAGAAYGQTAWERYLDDPKPQNAAAVGKLEYTGTTDAGQKLSADDLQILQNQAVARDPQAFRLAVRLYHDSDGDVREGFGVLIGRVVRAQPAFFLVQLKRLGLRCAVLEWPLRSPGLEYVDRPAARQHEITERAAGLRAVKDRSLAQLKAECLDIIGGG